MGAVSVSGKNAVLANITPVDFVKKVLDHDLYAWQRQLFRLVEDVHKHSEKLVEIADKPVRLTINKQRTSAYALKARKLAHELKLEEDANGVA